MRWRQIQSSSEEMTADVGRKLAGGLRSGMVVALYGDLGAGKTVLSRGIARGLGITEPVTSPTFTVVQEYRRPDGDWLFHLDMYRIEDDEAALAFGVEEYLFAPDGIALVEWPERIEGLLVPGLNPDGSDSDLVRLRLTHAGNRQRSISVPISQRIGAGQ